MREEGGSSLLHNLEELRDSDMLPLHMPGHKRKSVNGHMNEIYGIDITEIDDFDDLHDPDGLIKVIEERFARLYGAGRAYLSVNGSTSCNEAAILSMCRRGDEIIIPRASHKSVYHAIEIGGLSPVYVRTSESPVAGVILPPSPDEIELALKEHPKASCVVITSPTYEGLIADVEGIAQVVRGHGGVLIVDSAHGAHRGIQVTGADQEKPDGQASEPVMQGVDKRRESDRCMYPGPLMQGADICVVSLHKMLPAPTQTALVLVRDGDEYLYGRLRHYLDVFISSSPSYVLMAGAGECLEYMEKDLVKDLARSEGLLERFRSDCSVLKYIDVSPVREGADTFKIVIRGKDAKISGKALYDRLRIRHHIQCEMYGEGYVLALMSVVDDESSYDRLLQALKCEDDELSEESVSRVSSAEPCVKRNIASNDNEMPEGSDDNETDVQTLESMFTHIPDRYMDPGGAVDSGSRQVLLDEKAHGLISGSYICVYPPGIPVIIPGEIIDKRVTDAVSRGLEKGLRMTGMTDGHIQVFNRKDNE